MTPPSPANHQPPPPPRGGSDAQAPQRTTTGDPVSVVAWAAVRLSARRLAGLALLWWVLTEGSAWAWGVPVILITALAMPLSGLSRLHLPACLALCPVALWLALRGGVQVALLACRPRLDLHSAVIDHRWSCLPEGPGRLFMASLINLIPGTLTVRLAADRLVVHVLHLTPATTRDLAVLERRIARLHADQKEID
ncbi:Na+/H+ antiporter subunit E [Halomonas sp. ML-15]|uniref:Na+/H+ antiporter subunit E n=1 Tax=Halomonas sp. ML-15 TaxID=2773305 RepID=UPI001745DDA5|nr:Na+/H+ antiporter subunit E [Halomonas sp. ML-15]MBD3896269.1 Na+/H+ antiporter subunit E [Halomonas sp. ML-15]